MRFTIFIFLIFSSIFGHAQHAENPRIKKLLKQALNNDSAAVTMYNLGKEYMLLQNFSKAVNVFEVAYDKHNDIENNIVLLKALHAKGDFNRAREILAEKDKKVRQKEYLKTTIESVETLDNNPLFKIIPLPEINSKQNEISATVYRKGLVYAVQNKFNLINKIDAQGESYFDMIYLPFKGDWRKFKSPNLLSKELSGLSHDGPACFSSDRNTVYFCSENAYTKESVQGRSQIYQANYLDGKWNNIKLIIKDENAATMHPFITQDGSQLFFSSNKAGGSGGYDIYYCNKIGENWSNPYPLNQINTSGNEGYPSLYKGDLYYSSDGKIGVGGYDIYKATKKSQWNESVNMNAPINSGSDDFALIFRNEESGYFTSNRYGGQGGDDIYAFQIRMDLLSDKKDIHGKVEYYGEPIGAVTLTLRNQDGEIIDTITSDTYGRFIFEDLPVDAIYIIEADSPIVDNKDELKLFITNSNGDKVLMIEKLLNGTFQFELLATDDFDNIDLINAQDKSFLSIDLYGKIYDQIPGDAAKESIVYLVDADGNIVRKTRINRLGDFLFENLTPEETFLFMIESPDPDLNLYVETENGLQKIVKSKIDQYQYQRVNKKNSIEISLEEGKVAFIEKGEFFNLSIFYAVDEWQLNSDAQSKIEGLITMLKNNPHISIELSSHTDSRASDEYNLKLSNQRAKEAVRNIIAAGINENRVRGNGYGETKLLNKCTDDVECSEEQHRTNRRTEILIISK